jgi:hypothetical protein
METNQEKIMKNMEENKIKYREDTGIKNIK